MKFLQYTAYLFVALFMNAVSAQSDNVLTDASVVYSDEVNLPSLQLLIDGNREEVTERWDDFWDDRFDGDLDRIDRNRNSATYLIEAAELPTISDKTMNVYSQLTDNGNRTKVSLAMSFGYDLPVTKSTYPEEYTRVERLMENFRTYFYEKHFDAQIEVVMEELEDVREDKEDAADDQSKAAKKIRKYQEKIKKLEEKIVDEREELNDEEIVEMNKQDRIRELEQKLSLLQKQRSEYVK